MEKLPHVFHVQASRFVLPPNTFSRCKIVWAIDVLSQGKLLHLYTTTQRCTEVRTEITTTTLCVIQPIIRAITCWMTIHPIIDRTSTSTTQEKLTTGRGRGRRQGSVRYRQSREILHARLSISAKGQTSGDRSEIRMMRHWLLQSTSKKYSIKKVQLPDVSVTASS